MADTALIDALRSVRGRLDRRGGRPAAIGPHAAPRSRGRSSGGGRRTHRTDTRWRWPRSWRPTRQQREERRSEGALRLRADRPRRPGSVRDAARLGGCGAAGGSVPDHSDPGRELARARNAGPLRYRPRRAPRSPRARGPRRVAAGRLPAAQSIRRGATGPSRVCRRVSAPRRRRRGRVRDSGRPDPRRHHRAGPLPLHFGRRNRAPSRCAPVLHPSWAGEAHGGTLAARCLLYRRAHLRSLLGRARPGLLRGARANRRRRRSAARALDPQHRSGTRAALQPRGRHRQRLRRRRVPLWHRYRRALERAPAADERAARRQPFPARPRDPGRRAPRSVGGPPRSSRRYAPGHAGRTRQPDGTNRSQPVSRRSVRRHGYPPTPSGAGTCGRRSGRSRKRRGSRRTERPPPRRIRESRIPRAARRDRPRRAT